MKRWHKRFFLIDTVSQHDSWKVQEILAMAFDNHCKIIEYEVALPLIKEWLNSDCANVRRADSEGLRYGQAALILGIILKLQYSYLLLTEKIQAKKCF